MLMRISIPATSRPAGPVLTATMMMLLSDRLFDSTYFPGRVVAQHRRAQVEGGATLIESL